MPVTLPLHDRSFDLVLLSNWEDQIIYEPDISPPATPPQPPKDLTTPLNKALESGLWTQSIIWSPRAPFRDFTQLEVNEEDLVQEERPARESCTPLITFNWLIFLQLLRSLDQRNASEQITERRVISSTSQMINFMRSLRRAVVIASDKRSVNWSLNMLTLRRNSNCHS